MFRAGTELLAAQQIVLGDDADNLSIIDNGDSAKPMLAQQAGDILMMFLAIAARSGSTPRCAAIALLLLSAGFLTVGFMSTSLRYRRWQESSLRRSDRQSSPALPQTAAFRLTCKSRCRALTGAFI
jgi:hypothetical protein